MGLEKIRLTNLAVFDGDGALPGLTSITIGDGRILAVGPSGAPAPDDGARMIDMRGYHALPGLIDAHTHLVGGDVLPATADYGASRRSGEGEAMAAFRTIEAARLTLSRGITTVRDMSGRDWIDRHHISH